MSINRSTPRPGRFLFLLWVPVTCLLGGLAQAQTALSNCERISACLSFFEQAHRQHGLGNLREAERSFRQAYAASDDPRLLFNIARMLHKQGRGRAAIPYYRRFLESSTNDVEQKRQAERYLLELLLIDRPLYKEWWLWTLVGGATSVAVAGLAGGLSSQTPGPMLPATSALFVRTF